MTQPSRRLKCGQSRLKQPIILIQDKKSYDGRYYGSTLKGYFTHKVDLKRAAQR